MKKLIYIAVLCLVLIPCFSYRRGDSGSKSMLMHPRLFPVKTLGISDTDSISSVDDCRWRVAILGGGTCDIPPDSLHAGIHNRLTRGPLNVKLKVIQ